jgi:hypothetical protein
LDTIEERKMASKSIEKEIDSWVETCPLRRRTIMNRPQVIKDGRYYDSLWRSCLKDIEKQAEQDKAIKAFGG